MNIGAPEIILIILAILLLFGYKKLPAASRSLGQSLRIFKGEMKGMKSDDVADKDAATVTPARAELTAPLPRDAPRVWGGVMDMWSGKGAGSTRSPSRPRRW